MTLFLVLVGVMMANQVVTACPGSLVGPSGMVWPDTFYGPSGPVLFRRNAGPIGNAGQSGRAGRQGDYVNNKHPSRMSFKNQYPQ